MLLKGHIDTPVRVAFKLTWDSYVPLLRVMVLPTLAVCLGGFIISTILMLAFLGGISDLDFVFSRALENMGAFSMAVLPLPIIGLCDYVVTRHLFLKEAFSKHQFKKLIWDPQFRQLCLYVLLLHVPDIFFVWNPAGAVGLFPWLTSAFLFLAIGLKVYFIRFLFAYAIIPTSKEANPLQKSEALSVGHRWKVVWAYFRVICFIATGVVSVLLLFALAGLGVGRFVSLLPGFVTYIGALVLLAIPLAVYIFYLSWQSHLMCVLYHNAKLEKGKKA